jgi:hypothetical protein
MGPLAKSDGHDGPWLIDEFVPGIAAMVDDVAPGLEHAVGQPVVAQILPDVLCGVQLWRLRRQGKQADICWDLQLGGSVPAGLIEQDHRMCARRDSLGDFGEMQAHRRAVAPRQHEGGAGSAGWTDCAEYIGRGGALIVRCRRPRPTLCPTAGNLVLLADPGFVLEPDLYWLAWRIARRELCRALAEVYGMARPSTSAA